MGVSRQSVSKWEQDIMYPDTDKIIKISQLFRCSTDFLLIDDYVDRKETHRKAVYRSGESIVEKKAEGKKQEKSTRKKQKTHCEFDGMEPILELNDISKHFLKSEKVSTVFQNVNLSFYRGEFVALTGESGCGKTTLAGIISGNLVYDTGEISFEGKKYS